MITNTKTKLVRNIPSNIMLAIQEQAPRQSNNESKSGERRPDSNQIIVHAVSLRALGFPLNYQTEEIEHLALQIAQRQRAQDSLQQEETIRTKLEKELSELTRTQNPDEQDYRIASVIYYYVQQFLYDHDIMAYRAGLQRLAEAYHTPLELLLLICLAKFRDRAARDSKDVHREKAAISLARTNFFDQQKLMAKTLD